MLNKIFQTTKLVGLAIVLSLGLSYVYAWTAPTTTPPGGNTSAPINTSATLQQKSGALTVAGFVADFVTVGVTPTAGAISAPKFCLGTSCITSWPTGAELGVGQTWQNVTANRVFGTLYTNTTSRTIVVIISGYQGVTQTNTFYINGVIVGKAYESSSSGSGFPTTLIVPSGSTYMIVKGGVYSQILAWAELR